jgi:hypothetical protein
MDLGGVHHQMGIGQDLFSFDYDTRAGHLDRFALGPGLERVGIGQRSNDFDDGGGWLSCAGGQREG